ncbi:MAG: haloacid dehalogenase-like hydrolase [Tissierellia bacterium]|nr:haloacid dehalogenase-like hydrolase [Tissierellia bacterium]
MVKRILDLETSDIYRMNKEEKLTSIKAGEGRTIISEIICVAPPLLWDVSNVELAAAFGADILLLNMYDVNNPKIEGIPSRNSKEFIGDIKKLTGRMIGVNLEPVDLEENIHDRLTISEGRIATVENVKKLVAQGVDMVLLTGNPKTGVTNNKIIKAIKEIKQFVGDDIIIAAGKMHGSGSIKESGAKIISKEFIGEFIEAGSDIILIPAPGTVPGITVDYVRELVDYVHSYNRLAMTSIGTSQEGADEYTIRNIAIYSKMTGTDIHHIGDCGMSPGMAIPENIMIYSIAIKGKRHTYRKMARSINR